MGETCEDPPVGSTVKIHSAAQGREVELWEVVQTAAEDPAGQVLCRRLSDGDRCYFTPKPWKFEIVETPE